MGRLSLDFKGNYATLANFETFDFYSDTICTQMAVKEREGRKSDRDIRKVGVDVQVQLDFSPPAIQIGDCSLHSQGIWVGTL